MGEEEGGRKESEGRRVRNHGRRERGGRGGKATRNGRTK